VKKSKVNKVVMEAHKSRSGERSVCGISYYIRINASVVRVMSWIAAIPVMWRSPGYEN
jgi:hypothetical protein